MKKKSLKKVISRAKNIYRSQNKINIDQTKTQHRSVMILTSDVVDLGGLQGCQRNFLGKCHGSHSKDRKDKYNGKYRERQGKRQTKTRMSENEE